MEKTIGEELELVKATFQIAKKLKDLADMLHISLDMYSSCRSMHEDLEAYNKMIHTTTVNCDKIMTLLNEIKKNFNIE